jgi:Cu(I)/Ag(I) efflux system periplasmic protein CusF
MRNPTRLMLLTAPLALAACDAGDQASVTSETPTAAQGMPMSEDMPMTQSGQPGQTASGEGTVTAVDTAAGTVTIDHGPIPAVGWPAMAMTFKADEAARQNVAKGDEVTFAFRKTDGGGEITSIAKK